jgi:hypothetical protein
MQHFQELGDIVEMQAGGRFVENVEGAAGRALGQLLCKLDPLRLAARERGGLLADLDVAQADTLKRLQLVAHGGDGREELDTFLDRHVEHVGNRLSLELTSSVSRL